MAVLDMSYMSYSLKRYVHCKIILPLENTKQFDADFSTAPDRFKTLYLLHGFSGNEGDWIYGTEIFKIARDKHLAVVMPSGENSFYIDDRDRGLLMNQYIGEELVKATRRLFPLSERREDTFIAGLSMGAFGCMHVGSRYPETFSKIIALSGVYDPKDILMQTLLVSQNGFSREYYDSLFLKEKDTCLDTLVRNKQQDCFLACGREDPLYASGRAAYEYLKNNGKDAVWFETEGNHDFVFWNEGIKRGIQWLGI